MQKTGLFSVQQTGEITDLVKSMNSPESNDGRQRQSRVVDVEVQHSQAI